MLQLPIEGEAMTEPSAAIVALKELLSSLALKAAADRHGSIEQAADAQKQVEYQVSRAYSVLHEHDHTRAEPAGNYQQPAMMGQQVNQIWTKNLDGAI